MISPSQTSKQQLGSLGRKPLLVAPLSIPSSLASSPFLERTERVEINEVRVRDGVTFYVLDVFLYHVSSRLPTNVANQQSLVGSASPDLQVERRFSEFVKLRSQVSDATMLKLDCVCAYCAEFSMFLSFSMHQPRALTRITVVSTEKRKKILVSFLNEFVRLGKKKELQNHNCETHEPVPNLIERFTSRYANFIPYQVVRFAKFPLTENPVSFIRNPGWVAAVPVSHPRYHFDFSVLRSTRHLRSKDLQGNSSTKPRSLRVMTTHLAHKLPWAANGEVYKHHFPQENSYERRAEPEQKHNKVVQHLVRCFTDALKEFAASDTDASDEEKEQYNLNTWDGVIAESRGARMGYHSSLLRGYVQLNLILMDPEVFIPIIQFGR